MKYISPFAGSRAGKVLAGVGGAHIWFDGFDKIFDKNL